MLQHYLCVEKKFLGGEKRNPLELLGFYSTYSPAFVSLCHHSLMLFLLSCASGERKIGSIQQNHASLNQNRAS